jgi:hypothetical protein
LQFCLNRLKRPQVVEAPIAFEDVRFEGVPICVREPAEQVVFGNILGRDPLAIHRCHCRLVASTRRS